METSTVVIKVKYGDMLRRFNAQIIDYKLNLNMDGLRERILSLFSFAPDTELMLTYIDEDSDVVALVDDDDLHDVMEQDLNPLRITVKVNDEKSGFQNNESSASSTPLRSPRVQQPLPNLNTGISEILRKVPDPLHGTLMKLSNDLASKAMSSAPSISELVEVLSKVSLSHLGQPSEPQTGVKSSRRAGVPESSTSSSETKNSEPLEKVEPETIMERNEVKSHNEASSFDFSAVAAALESQNKNVGHPGNDSLRNLTPAYPESYVPFLAVGKKSKLKKILKNSSWKSQLTGDFPAVANIGGKVAESCIGSSVVKPVVDKNLAGKGVCNHSEPKLGVNSGNISASDPTTGDNVNDKIRSGGKSPTSILTPQLGASNLGSYCGPISAAHDCPFSGSAMGLISAAPPYSADPVFSRGITIQNDGSGNVFHRGVRCDGCGIHPIVGPRFKSKVKLDFDLCRICFEKYGNSNDYIRMERPAVFHPTPFKGMRNAWTMQDQVPMISHVYRGSKAKLCPMKLDSRFIQDVNIFDGTIMEPSTPFTKIWRMRNNGTLMWPSKTQLVWIGGDKLSNALSVEVQIPAAGLLIDQELDIAVDFISPDLPGRYISYWRMASPTGQKFGQRVWVLIQVDASVKEAPRESVRDLNLNLPPVSSSLTGPEIINVDLGVVEETRPVVANNSKKIVESGKPEADQELKFPINDSLLVGNGASTSIPSSSAAPSASYPIIDLSEVPPPLSSVFPSVLFPIPPPPPLPLPTAPVTSTQQSAVDHPGKNQMEEELLKELEEMGFKQVDLNKEVLRLNEYDLEQAVDDLCGVAEWDPILEELKEMGFCDTETNKMLLKKNNGSIKRVVMDLIAGEKV